MTRWLCAAHSYRLLFRHMQMVGRLCARQQLVRATHLCICPGDLLEPFRARANAWSGRRAATGSQVEKTVLSLRSGLLMVTNLLALARWILALSKY